MTPGLPELAARVESLDRKLTKLEDSIHSSERNTMARTSTVETRMSSIEMRQVKTEGILLDLLMSSTATTRGMEEVNATLMELGDKISALLERAENGE